MLILWRGCRVSKEIWGTRMEEGSESVVGNGWRGRDKVEEVLGVNNMA